MLNAQCDLEKTITQIVNECCRIYEIDLMKFANGS